MIKEYRVRNLNTSELEITALYKTTVPMLHKSVFRHNNILEAFRAVSSEVSEKCDKFFIYDDTEWLVKEKNDISSLPKPLTALQSKRLAEIKYVLNIRKDKETIEFVYDSTHTLSYGYYRCPECKVSMYGGGPIEHRNGCTGRFRYHFGPKEVESVKDRKAAGLAITNALGPLSFDKLKEHFPELL